MILIRTPFRISFFGGGTDYEPWYSQHGGAVLATTIDKYCYTQVRDRIPWDGYQYRLVYREQDNANHVDDIQHPVIRNALRCYPVIGPLEVHHDADLPARSGIGSSSAFAVGLTHALQLRYHEPTNEYVLAERAIYVERKLCNEFGGIQDQIMAAHGGFRLVQIFKDGTYFPEKIASPRLRELEERLMLFYVGGQRTAAVVAKSYNLEHPALELIRRSVDRAVAILKGHGELDDFGRLMHEAWELKQQLSPDISNSEIGQYYRRGCDAGALGGKLLGAGGGGFLLFYVPTDRRSAMFHAMEDLHYVPFHFSMEGSKVIYREP
jgi:D-glycero-alpha-D-manno-heptose-7-phosphate kinase